MFQCSSASRKFLNAQRRRNDHPAHHAVSVLFSEPKIPQLYLNLFEKIENLFRFSALQRAENSSMF